MQVINVLAYTVDTLACLTYCNTLYAHELGKLKDKLIPTVTVSMYNKFATSSIFIKNTYRKSFKEKFRKIHFLHS